jgi:hypothetical protein
VCVHARAPEASQVSAALAALEWAYERVVLALGLPEPLRDDGAGGTEGLDLYLHEVSEPLLVEPSALARPPFTRAPAFCLAPAVRGDLLLRAATQCVAEAVALALDASEPPHLRRAFATAVWWGVGSPTSLDVEAIDDVQAHPEAPIVTRDLGPTSEGAGLFFAYLEGARSAGEPFALSSALFAAAASSYDEVDLTYRNEPDVFDVLRHSLDDDAARFAAMMADFTVARAFVGARDDGQHLPELAWAGAFGRARFDWQIAFSSLPRRVAIQPPVDSTGSVLLWVDLDEVPLGAALAVRAEWEAPVSFQWQLVKLGADGAEIGRLDVPFQQRGREAEVRMTELLGARSVIVAGTNLEGIELAHPFDPDVAPFEPHGVSVYLARL